MRRLFKQAAKLERNRDRLAAQVARTEQTLAALDRLVADLEAWVADWQEGTPFDESFTRRARDLGVPLPQAAAPPAPPPRPLSKREKREAALKAGVREFTSHDNLAIYVGKSDRDNDALTFRLARGNDHWFHLAAAPGSHVVAVAPPDGVLPQETLLDAAHLAVHFSKMRGATKADVTHTQAKHVRRIRGAPPGKVRVERSDTILVRLEANRLARLTGKEQA
jgi:hypothetical protein